LTVPALAFAVLLLLTADLLLQGADPGLLLLFLPFPRPVLVEHEVALDWLPAATPWPSLNVSPMVVVTTLKLLPPEGA